VVTDFVVTRSVPGGTQYDPLVQLPGEDAYEMHPDRFGRISITLGVTHTSSGTITTSIRDADGARITSATGNTPTLTFEPLKYRYPFIITVETPEGDPVFTRFITSGKSGGANDPGFIGSPSTTDSNIDSDDEYTIPQEDDYGDYETEGKDASSGSCGSCSSSSCDLSNSDETANADATGDDGTFHAGFDVGTSMQGDSETGVDVAMDPGSGVSLSSFKSHGTGDATIIRNSGNLESITTGSAHAVFAEIVNGVSVSFSKAPNGTVYRTITFVNTASNQVTRTSNFMNKSVQTVWTYDPQARKWTITMGNGARKFELIREDNGSDSTKRVERRFFYERAASSQGVAAVPVADIRQTRNRTILGWRKTKSEILGAASGPLTTAWEYFGPADGLDKAGLIKSGMKPGLGTKSHDYFQSGGFHYHPISKPFADGSQTSVETRRKTPTSSTSDVYEMVGPNYVSQRQDTWSGNTMTRSQHDGASFTTTTHTISPFGSDFGGTPNFVAPPDGTAISQSRTRTGGGQYCNRVIERGEPNGSGGVSNGTRTETSRNNNGIIASKYVTAVGTGSGVVLKHFNVTAFDTLGRPQTVEYFPGTNGPAYTITRSFSCCGLSSQTDKYGVTTQYQYDDLRRLIRTNRLGVTHATVYDGITVRSHRYAGTVNSGTWTGSPSDTNEISNSTRDLSATFRHSWERSPQTEASNPDAAPPSYSSNPTLFTTTEYRHLNAASSNPNPHNLPTGVHLRIIRQSVQVADDTSRPLETEDRNADGRVIETISDLSPDTRHTYTSNATGLVVDTSYLDGANLRETTSTQYDRAGRVKSVTKAGATTNYFYGDTGAAKGKLVKVIDADLVTTLYGYNAEGERTTTATDVNGNGIIDEGGTDRITKTETLPGTYQVHHVLTTTTKVFATNNSATPKLVLTRHSSTDGLHDWTIPIDSPPSSSVTVLSGGGTFTRTTTHSDGTQTVESHTNGRLASVATLNSAAATLHTTSYGYDALGRQETTTDSRTGTTTNNFLSTTCDFVGSVEDPGLRVTAYTYDHRGRQKSVNAPDTLDASGATLTNITTTTHFPDGSAKTVGGGQAYPVSYTYDYAGRMKTMTTTGSAGNATTTWNYYTGTGLLREKLDHTNKGPEYFYTAAGRLQHRDWARVVPNTTNRVRTTYGYTNGLLTSVTYNDGTPNLVYTPDRLGRTTNVTRAGNNHAYYDYDPTTLRLTTEKLTRDTHERHLIRHYDSYGRPLSLNLTTTAGTSQYTTGYGYDNAGRLDRVWHHPTLIAGVPQGNPTFTYGYTYTQATPADLRVGATSGGGLKQDFMPYTLTRNAAGANPALTANRTYQATRDVLHSIENRAGANLVSSYTYGVNDIGQRGSVTTAGTAFAGTQADWTWGYDALGQVVKADSNTTAYDRAFEYDTIGNRKKFAHGSITLPTSDNYTATLLNQYTVVPTYTPQPAHDLDGNLTRGPIPGTNGNVPGVQPPADATLIEWDAENRMISCTIGASTYRYEYDHLSRLILYIVNGSVLRNYHYDRWNRISEFNGTDPLDTFTWGLDLSGSMQGAGGVGGLLATRWVSASNLESFPCYDGNGNVVQYLSPLGNPRARFEYDSFGTLTRLSFNINPIRFQYRFSTKPRDFNTGLYYYGYRWYDPTTSRWPSRDPIEERGGVNLYGFVGNNGVCNLDILGLIDCWYLCKNKPPEQMKACIVSCERSKHNKDNQPTEPNDKKHHETGNLSCCDDAKIQEGLVKLNELYENFKKDKTPETPDAGACEWSGWGFNGEGSCNQVNSELMGYLQGRGVPECWKCSLVHGWRIAILTSPNHWWIECTAYGADGLPKKTVQYDWWTGENPGGSSIVNRIEYSFNGDNSPEAGGYPDIYGPNFNR
jgi:RHS repeat-associated protein